MAYRRNNVNELGVKYPCYGEYLCTSCNRRWESIKAWRDYEQECTRCKILVKPSKLDELYFYNCDNCKKYWKYKRTAGNDCRNCGLIVYPKSKNEHNRSRQGGQGQRGGGGGRSNNYYNYNGNEERSGTSSNSFNKSASTTNDSFSDNESNKSGHGNENNGSYDNSFKTSFNASSTSGNENQTSRSQNPNYFHDEEEKGSWRTSNMRRIDTEDLFYKKDIYNQPKEIQSETYSNQTIESTDYEPEPNVPYIKKVEVESTQELEESTKVPVIDQHDEKISSKAGNDKDFEVRQSTIKEKEAAGNKENILELLKGPVKEAKIIEPKKQYAPAPDKISNSSIIGEDKNKCASTQAKENLSSKSNENEPHFVSELFDDPRSSKKDFSNKNDVNKDEAKSPEGSTLKYVIIGSSILLIGMFLLFKKN